MNFEKGCHETFSQTEGANSLQFLLMIEVLPLNSLKIGSLYQGCKYRVGKLVQFPVAINHHLLYGSYDVW